MKKIIITLLVTALSQLAFAQYAAPLTEYKIYPGTITMPNGSVVKGYILNRGVPENQNQISFYTERDGKTRKVYRPSDLQAFTIENNQFRSVPYSGSLKLGKANNHFVFVASPGAITTYKYWGPEEQIFWQKGNEEPVLSSSMIVAYKKNISKLFADYPALLKRVEARGKAYAMLNLDKIVEEYNTWAAAKQ
ncbi:hypothetical protein [Daejeonella sp.]|uniref:hypothetical protein n=1 Tax=Daejeonella sp. TaxID=2805397 RepID=UPI0030BEF271